MREIQILKLTLENFKCHRALTMEFDGRNASVYGNNATGKTSIYDALTWLLFGKDSAGNGEKNTEIKPLGADGEVLDHDALTSVEAVLMVRDGADSGTMWASSPTDKTEGACSVRQGCRTLQQSLSQPTADSSLYTREPLGNSPVSPLQRGASGADAIVTLKRTYKEVWTTKRGSSQATYDGNTSEYFVDGVPMKANAFKEAVRELVDEDTFLMLTAVDAFASRMDWRKRREALFRLAGIQDDRMIMGTDERFLPLLEAMGRSDLDGLKRKLAADKKGLSVTKNELPARLSECDGILTTVSGLDFDGASLQASVLRGECDRLSAQLASLDQSGEIRVLQADLKEANVKRDRIVAENDLYRKNQMSGTTDVLPLNLRATAVQNRLTNKQNAMTTESQHMRLMDIKIDEYRNKWMQVNSEVYHGDSICPTCGQSLPAMRVQVAKDAWEEDKQKRLDAILKEAESVKNNKAMAEERYADLQKELDEAEQELSEIRKQITEATANRVEPKDMEGYAEALAAVEGEIAGINGKLFEMRGNAAVVRQRLETELQTNKDKLCEAEEILSKKSVLEYTQKRVEELKENAKDAAEKLDGVERLLFLCEEYSRYKTSFVEDSVNDLFRIARFRLYREQANGGVEDRCDVVHNGVPYNSVNNGMKINLGIDIINTLSAAYGVRVPLFIDNAESVTNLEHCHSQRIRLVVSEMDKELRVNYEN